MIVEETNCFDAPFLIFIKGINHLSDNEVFKLLGVRSFEIIDSLEEKESSLYLTRCQNWIHIMDNWLYNLYHKTSFKNRLDDIGKICDIFYCSIGDIDDSFDFTYFQDGKLRRKYVLNDTVPKNQVIEQNIGEVLPLEEEILSKEIDVQIKIVEIAKSVGIGINHKEENIICYQYDLPK